MSEKIRQDQLLKIETWGKGEDERNEVGVRGLSSGTAGSSRRRDLSLEDLLDIQDYRLVDLQILLHSSGRDVERDGG